MLLECKIGAKGIKGKVGQRNTAESESHGGKEPLGQYAEGESI